MRSSIVVLGKITSVPSLCANTLSVELMALPLTAADKEPVLAVTVVDSASSGSDYFSLA